MPAALKQCIHNNNNEKYKIVYDNDQMQNTYSCIDVRAMPVSRHFVFQYQFTNAIVSITHSINMRPAFEPIPSLETRIVCHALIDVHEVTQAEEEKKECSWATNDCHTHPRHSFDSTAK